MDIKFSIRRYFDELLSVKWLVIGILIFFYGTLLKKQLVEIAFINGMKINNWDISLYLFNDMYIIIYFVVPITLILSTSTILGHFNYEVLIRIGSIKKWILSSFKRFWIQSSIFLMIWVFMCLFLTIGLPNSWSWSQFSHFDNLNNVLNGVSINFSTPLIVFILQLILFAFAISVLHMLLL